MSGARKNTLVVDFSVLPIRPEIAKVQEFLEKEIKLQYTDVRSVQLHHTRHCVYIEMQSHEIAARYHAEHNGKRAMLCGTAKFRIPVYVDREAVTVRILDLPPSMSPVTITDHMLKYGEVISIRNEKWKHYFPGISNGVRVLRMNLLRHIPSFITIENHETMVSYDEQPKTCRQCGHSSHPGNGCPDSSTATANQSPSTSLVTKSTDKKFTQDDFPPINDDRQKLSSPVLIEPPGTKQQKNDDDDDDCTDDNTSSSTEHNEAATNKRRRRSRRNQEGTKKACSIQCSPNTDHLQIVLPSDVKKTSSKTVNDNSANIVNDKK